VDRERAVTVEEASARLARGMREGSIRSRDGTPYKPSSARTYEESLRLLVLPRVGGAPVEAMTRGDVQRLVDAIAADRTPDHARKALTALRVVLRICERYGEVPVNPCSGVRVPTNPEWDERPPRVLTVEEVTAIIRCAQSDDSRIADHRRKRGATAEAAPLLALLAGTGLRLGEALALTWSADSLDLHGGIVHVRFSVDRQRAEDATYAVVAPKSRAARREVPLPPSVADRLTAYADRSNPEGLVFRDRSGRHLPQQFARQVLARACDAAGIDDPQPRVHDLRHAYATHQLRAGLTAHAVAKLLGHADASLVWRRYGHALPDELTLAGHALDALYAAVPAFSRDAT
jgi:integrase